VRFRVCPISSSISNCLMDNLRSGRAIRGSVEHSEGKDRESAMAILMFLCSSPRLCRLMTEGLVPMSKY
jgi:hypothetical protein